VDRIRSRQQRRGPRQAATLMSDSSHSPRSRSRGDMDEVPPDVPASNRLWFGAFGQQLNGSTGMPHIDMEGHCDLFSLRSGVGVGGCGCAPDM
jgi:hypothetical protein